MTRIMPSETPMTTDESLRAASTASGAGASDVSESNAQSGGLDQVSVRSETQDANQAHSAAQRVRIVLACIVAVVSLLVLAGSVWLLWAQPQPLSTGENSSFTEDSSREIQVTGEGDKAADASSDASRFAMASSQSTPVTDAQGTQESTQSGSSSSSAQAASGIAVSGGSEGPNGAGVEPSSSGDQGSVIAVTVSVDSSAAGGPVSGFASPSFEKGATPYDALMACGLSVNASQSSMGVYVRAIGGLAEKERGATSGWMYSVNGVTPMTSCSSYTLQNGDVVRWYYVV